MTRGRTAMAVCGGSARRHVAVQRSLVTVGRGPQASGERFTGVGGSCLNWATKEDPMIRNLAHLCLTVRDLDRSLGFYCGVLGMTPAFEFHNDQGEKYGQYIHVGGRTFIEIFKGDPAKRDDSQSYKHFCIEVDDLDAVIARLKESGVEVSEKKLGKDQSWQAWIEDPDGNRIELHCYTPQSKQAPYADGAAVG